jgi:hypothetical protein
MKSGWNILCVFWICGCVHHPEIEQGKHWQGWPEVWHVRGGGLELVLLPARGRMIHLSEVGESNLLWELPDERGVMERDAEDYWSWPNPGGDWLWPVQQSEWHRLGVPDKWRWPPPAQFDDQPWTARKLVDGSVEMTLEVGDPLHVRLTRRFVLSDAHPGVLRVEQSVVRTAPSEIPVTLWHLTQAPLPEEIVFESPEGSAFANAVREMGRRPLDPVSLRREENRWRWDLSRTGPCKIGNDGRWMEAIYPEYRLRIEAVGGREGGEFPDGGCSLTLVKGGTEDFVELETLSVERMLAPGERIENVLVYRIKDGR